MCYRMPLAPDGCAGVPKIELADGFPSCGSRARKPADFKAATASGLDMKVRQTNPLRQFSAITTVGPRSRPSTSGLNQSVAGLIKTGYETYRVTPGQHTITTECVFGSGVLSGQDPRHGYVDLTFTAKAGEHYLIQSKVTGARVQAWVTQANGRAVSSVESTSYDDIPSPSPVVIVTH